MPLPVYSDPPKSRKELQDRMIELIEGGWCQGSYALDVNKELIDPMHPLVCYVCLDGAFFRARVKIESGLDFLSLLRDKLSDKYYHNTVLFNDRLETTKKDVLNFVKSVEID